MENRYPVKHRSKNEILMSDMSQNQLEASLQNHSCIPNQEEDINYKLLQISIDRALDELTEKEADIVRDYFGLNEKGESLSLEQIGDKYHVQAESIRKIKEKAIGKLRHPRRAYLLEDFA